MAELAGRSKQADTIGEQEGDMKPILIIMILCAASAIGQTKYTTIHFQTNADSFTVEYQRSFAEGDTVLVGKEKRVLLFKWRQYWLVGNIAGTVEGIEAVKEWNLKLYAKKLTQP